MSSFAGSCFDRLRKETVRANQKDHDEESEDEKVTVLRADVNSAEGLDNKTRLNLMIALPVMHYCWGAGFIRGLFAKPIKNEARG